MKHLDDAALLTIYCEVTALEDIDQDFIELLKQELTSRGIPIPEIEGK